MTFGVQPSGFVPKLIGDIETDIETAMHANVAADLDLGSDQPLGQMKSAVASQAAECWELLRVAFTALNPEDAEGYILDGVCAYTGTKRSQATPSHVVLSMTLNATTTVPEGSMANVSGQPTNTWLLRGVGDPATGRLVTAGDVTSTTSGTYYGYFESSTNGPNVANAGTLSVITNSVTGWTAVTNVHDAIRGALREDDTALLRRRDAEIAAAGASTVDALRADLLDIDLVPGVIQAFVRENTGDVEDANHVPPHSLHVIVYDGIVPAASDADIAAVIWANKGAGISTYGSTAVAVNDSQGNPHTVYFDRATPVRYYVTLTLTTDTTFDAVNGPAAVKAALAAESASYQNLGVNVVALRLRAFALTVQGVVDVPTFALDTHSTPTATANITINELQIATLDTVDITVS